MAQRRNLKTEYFPFKGGLNLIDPPLNIHPGYCLGCQNYEIGINGGYRRIDGFERYDGLAKPSDASYWIVDFDAGTTEIPTDTAVQGGTSGATGTTLIAGVVESGSYGGNDAVGYLVLTAVTGTWQDNEDIELVAGSVKRAEAASVATENGADTDTLDTTYSRDAIETQRALIGAVTGSGNMRGVWMYNNVVYAFRDNAGGTAVVMFKSSASGWTACDLGFTLDFDAGTTEFTLDATITGAGGATGVVKKVVVESGTWAGNDAAGYVVLYSRNGTAFVNNETLTGSSGGDADADGIGLANTFSDGGRFEFVNYNFTGHSGSLKMYGVNGLDKAFEWDGSVFSWLPTGMTTDTPNHIEAHLNYLFLSFSGGSLQHSSLGDPTGWSVITGASELSVGDEITGLSVTPGMVLAVFCRNSTRILKGSSTQDWFLRVHSKNSGAIEWSIQQAQETTYLDDRGLTRLAQVQDFGDFKDNTISKLVQPRFDAQKSKVTASVAIKNKNQYIIYFDDDTALVATFAQRKISGYMDLDYGMVVRCIVSGEDSSGDEQVFFGSDDGYIYQLNSGTSFDGSSVGAFLRMAYNHFKTPQYWKRFRRVVFELNSDADPNMELEFAPDFSYSDPDIATPVAQDITLKGGGGFWNSATWNKFYWSGQAIGTMEGYIDGVGVNMSLLVNSQETYVTPHAIHGAVIHYSMRGLKR